jgi:membrane protein
MSLAVLVGAAFNAAADGVWPALTDIDPDEEVHDADERPI